MRTRKYIEDIIGNGTGLTFTEKTTIELLLDIRDLLANPPIVNVNAASGRQDTSAGGMFNKNYLS